VLEDTNLKLTSVATNILGVSARAMLSALLEGETHPEVLAGLARGKLRKKREQLEQALQGHVQEHHRFLLTSQLAHIDFLEEQVADCDAKIEQFIRQTSEQLAEPPASPATQTGSEPPPAQDHKQAEVSQEPLSYQQAIALLARIPGINQRIAEMLIAEIGGDMGRFPSAGHLASWVGICPGTHPACRQTGERENAASGDRWLRQALIEAAQGAMRTKDTYLSAQGQRLTRRRGKKRAVGAVAHTILVIAYYVLQRRQPYQDLGSNSFDERERAAVARQSIRRLEQRGFKVTLETTEEAA
jgi:transposase